MQKIPRGRHTTGKSQECRTKTNPSNGTDLGFEGPLFLAVAKLRQNLKPLGHRHATFRIEQESNDSRELIPPEQIVLSSSKHVE
jgi:hypothetical protein